MSYTALRAMKVQTASGKYEMRKPGDPVPEAASWPNPGLWVKRGYLKKNDGKAAHEIERRAPKPPRPVTKADLQARAERQLLKDQGLPIPSTDFEPASEHNIGPGKDQLPLVDNAPADDEGASTETTPAEVGASAKGELEKLTQKELLKLCKSMKIKASKRATKGDLVDAILALSAQAG
jgi:hypothetical protein